MKLFLKNSLFRTISLSRIFNNLGASIYNLVFIVFASSLPNARLTVGAANLILLVPMFFTIFVGIQADQTKEKAKWIIGMGYLQALLFAVVAFLTQSTTLLAFSLVCIINIFADILSDYRNSLQMPIFQKNIPEEDRMEAYSFSQFVMIICNLAGQALGVFLLTISHQNFFLVASVNALAYLLSASFLLLHKKDLTHDPVETKKEKVPFKEQIKALYQQAQLIFQQEGSGSFLQIIFIILVINAISNAIIAIFNISLLSQPFGHFSFSQSLLILEGSLISGMLLGSLTPHDYFSQISIFQIFRWATAALCLFGFFNLFHFPQLLSLVFLFFVAYLGAKLNPKINSMLLNQLPADVLGQTSSFISLTFTISIPIGTTLFTALAIWNLAICWLVYTGLSLLALYLSFKKQGKAAK